MQISDEIQGQYLSYARMKEARALPYSDPTRAEKYAYAVDQLRTRNRRAVIFYNQWIARKNEILSKGDYSLLEWLDKLQRANADYAIKMNEPLTSGPPPAAAPPIAAPPSTGSWYCASMNGQWLGLSLNRNGDVQCASPNGRDCIWSSSQSQCQQASSGNVSPLACGQQHFNLYGSTGYLISGHWCEIGQINRNRLQTI
jgi:hypothetical protein